jgi:formylglycine-generating enzyme required for sulfatase activity
MVLIRVNKDLQAGKFEVTQAEYKKVMGDAANPSKSLNDKQPVERVTWNDAVKFTRKLTEMERDRLPPGTAYSLPTEKQWKEFLGGQKFEDLPARGMTGRGEPAAVGQSGPPNRFGLFDVLGNVWEWCLDGATGEEKLLKGGAFNSANYDRTLLPDRQVSNCGFRCVLAAQ